MKLFLRIFFLILLLSISIGFYFDSNGDNSQGNKIIGFSVLIASFVFMPIFLVYRWKGKSLKDYTLSKENLNKLKDSNKNNI